MPIKALLLVFAAAALHTWWNYFVKKVTEKQVFTWWTLVLGCFLYIPSIFVYSPIPVAIWPYALVSALVESAFFITLVRAYEGGDFSLVYPVARGAAPAMLAVWAYLFLGERPAPGGIIGLCVLISGLAIVGGAGIISRRTSVRFSFQGLTAALLVSLWISIYSTIDGAAVRLWSPQGYAGLVLAVTAVFLSPAIFSRHSPGTIVAVLRSNWPRIAFAAVFMFVTYVLVLEAFRMTKVSYVAAIREMSVILAALAGWHFMGEEFGPIRTAGSILIFLGILYIAIAG